MNSFWFLYYNIRPFVVWESSATTGDISIPRLPQGESLKNKLKCNNRTGAACDALFGMQRSDTTWALTADKIHVSMTRRDSRTQWAWTLGGNASVHRLVNADGAVGEWALRTPRPTVITAVLSAQTWHHWGHIGSLSCLHKKLEFRACPRACFRYSDLRNVCSNYAIMHKMLPKCPSRYFDKNITNTKDTFFRVI